MKNRGNNNHRYFTREIGPDKVYFNYKRAPYLRPKWLIVLAVVVEIAVVLFELFFFQSAYLQVITIPLIMYLTYQVLKHKDAADEAIESHIVKEQLNVVLDNLEDGNLIANEYFIETPKEIYLGDKRFLLAVMSNGKVYRFGVERASHNGFVLDKKAIICTDAKELELVKNHTDKLQADKDSRAKRLTGTAAACIIVFGFAVFAILFWLGSKFSWMKIVWLALFGIFILSVSMSLFLQRYDGKKGTGGTLYKISSGVVAGIWLFFQLVFPSLLLLIGFIFIILLPAAIVGGVLTALSTIVQISFPTILFLSLSIGAITSAHYSKPLFGYLSKFLTANGHRYEKYFQEMVEYTYQPGNIQFAVNCIYVLFLAATTISQLQTSGESILGKDIDTAVLKSFLVFIAFSNVRTKRGSADFRFSELFRMMYKMWTVHDNTNEKEN